MNTKKVSSKLFINGTELEVCTVENFSINLGGSMKTKIEQAKSILSLNNKELSKLLGHHERYIERVLREGVSLVQEKLIVKGIDALLKMHDQNQQILKIEKVADDRLDKLQESEQNVRMLNMEVTQLKGKLEQAYKDVDTFSDAYENEKSQYKIAQSNFACAERDKRYMKRKLQDKSLVINWLLALNVFFVLFLIGKCVGLV